MKHLLIATFTMLLTGFSSKADPTEKVLSIFKKSFPEATETVWQNFEEVNSVSFKKLGMVFYVKFNLDGSFLSSVRHSDENGLPINLLCVFKKKHAEKSIADVAEVINDDGVQYYITAQDEKFIYWYKGNIYGELSLDKKLKK